MGQDPGRVGRGGQPDHPADQADASSAQELSSLIVMGPTLNHLVLNVYRRIEQA